MCAIKPTTTFALILAALTAAIDQAIKYYLREIVQLQEGVPVYLTQNFDLILAWNKGVSYSLLPQTTDMGQLALVGVKLLMVLWLFWWLFTSASKLQSLSLGLVIGGAFGNMIDNLMFGGVMDFVHFHIGTFSWYIFNFADVAIVAGVAGLFYAALWGAAPHDGDSAQTEGKHES